MGIFDKVLGSGSENLNEAEGFGGVAFLAVAADGVLTQEEQLALMTSLARMKLYSGMSQRQFHGVFEKLVKVARNEGVDALLGKAAAATPKDLRATAFAVATDLIMADGHVAAEEKKVLERMQHALGIEDALAMKIAEVIAIKNRG